MGDVLLSLFLAVLLMAGFIWPAIHGRRVRRRGFDAEVFPHNTTAAREADRAALEQANRL
ncbi:hypothetical protein [Streptomyces sp. NPDC060366]|uniref:hypothetical protein n=1 Tax=Streptomyces sp. NPDC060366 TaxID=3347105 RepID=UPI0036574F92